MKIYEDKKGGKWIDSGEIRGHGELIKHGEVALYDSRVIEIFEGGILRKNVTMLRPATPEEIAESEKPKLTLPLVEGQIVICRDGVERTVTQIYPSGSCLMNDGFGSNVRGHFWNAGTCFIDAIADSPRWKQQKKNKDGKEKQTRAAEVAQSNRAEVAPQVTGAKPVSVAQPAILPDWTDGDVSAEAEKRNLPIHIIPSTMMRAVIAWQDSPMERASIRQPDAPDGCEVARKWRTVR